ncbi:MAG: GspH/FimT family pseudopilin, partial [Pseudomonas sp.]|uniref:GspH/FimT family pseudopilin n=1 Tax=Pseudomonas sp. TaxID=306 RepID=UPI003BB57BD0
PTDRLSARRGRGFSLVELMVALAVAAILAGIAIPAFDSFTLKNRLSTYASAFSASARLARSEALKRNTPVTLCRSSDGSTCADSGSWEQGWIVLSGTTVIRHQQAAVAGYLLLSSINTDLTFQPNGFVSIQATLTVCRSSPLAGEEREVTVSATGRTTIKKTYTGSCS